MEEITELINTVLGEVEFKISFTNNSNLKELKPTKVEISQNNKKISKFYNSKQHQIEVIHLVLPSKIRSGEELIAIKAIFVRFYKTGLELEKAKISFKLLSDLYGTPNTGEDLDSVLFENENYKVSIGTEDSDALMNRGKYEDCFPKRFLQFFEPPEYSYYSTEDFLKYKKKGFEINFPELLLEEKVEFRFIIAQDYYEEDSVSTWLASDIFVHRDEIKKLLE